MREPPPMPRDHDRLRRWGRQETRPRRRGGNMTACKNRQMLLASRPRGEPTPDNFKLVETEIPQPGPGRMLLRTIYLSLDPYMRGRMNAGPSYARPVEVGEVMG